MLDPNSPKSDGIVAEFKILFYRVLIFCFVCICVIFGWEWSFKHLFESANNWLVNGIWEAKTIGDYFEVSANSELEVVNIVLRKIYALEMWLPFLIMSILAGIAAVWCYGYTIFIREDLEDSKKRQENKETEHDQ